MMAEFGPHMGDPHGDPQTSPQHADPHGFLVLLSLSLKRQESMWIGVLRAGLRVAMWITPCGGQISPHGLLEKSLNQILLNFGGGFGVPQLPPLPFWGDPLENRGNEPSIH